MSSSAIIMLIVAIALIWGGLATALVHLSRHPDQSGTDDEQADTLAPWAHEA
ncbi:methionine/alanine import family NSS transporter small subunit [Rothia sp. CCM 9417]|uniref:methionine/alanine import family NSS transporter small subunit n=1 Tax=unclassified Rothia (in: high G+C Gram-positive bacteria) TaxID=2689056 RepID=UPI003AC68EE9